MYETLIICMFCHKLQGNGNFENIKIRFCSFLYLKTTTAKIYVGAIYIVIWKLLHAYEIYILV